MTLDDLKRHYAAQVRGDRLMIAVVGDFDAADVRRRLEEAFGVAGRAPRQRPLATRGAARGQGRRVLLVDKPGATQTYFWLGNVGASRTDPARTAQDVVNTVFGGRFTSMLNTELRIKSGLTYGAGSGFDRLAEPGAFRITSFTATESTVPASTSRSPRSTGCTRTGSTPRRSTRRGPTCSGSSRPRIETNGALAGRLADLLLYGLGREDVDGFAARVDGRGRCGRDARRSTGVPGVGRSRDRADRRRGTHPRRGAQVRAGDRDEDHGPALRAAMKPR